MATLSSRLVISLVDQVSGPARGLKASMQSLQKEAAKIGKIAHKVAGGSLTLAAPGALSLHSMGHKELEWDRLLHQYQAITEISPEGLERVKKAIIQTSNETGVSRQELLEAAKGWVELGNAPETFIENAKVAARTSRIVGVSVAEQMKESSALLRAFKGSHWNPEDFKHFEEVYMVASKGMKGGAHAFGEAMKMWAPIASAMGLTIEQASAFVQTLGGQFQPTEIGNALKTGFMRLSAPTPKSAAAMRYAGIDETKLYNVDKTKLDGGKVSEGLRGAGFSVSKKVEEQIAKVIATTDLTGGTGKLVDNLREVMTRAFGKRTKSGKYMMDAKDSAVVQQAILSLVGNAKTTLNPMEFFKQFGPHANNVAFMSQVFGKEHAAKIIDLLKQGEHYVENYERIMKQVDGALGRKWDLYAKGFAFEWSRVQETLTNFLGSIGGSGIKEDLESMFQSISGFFEKMQEADPAMMKFLFWSTVAAAALPLVGLYVGTAGFALSALTGFATAAGGAMFFLARGLWAATGGALISGLISLGGAARTAAAGFLVLSGVSRGAAIGALFTGLGSAVLGAMAGLLPFLGIGLAVAAVVLAIAAAGMFIYQNWNGLGSFFSGFGEGFKEALGPLAPIAEKIGGAIKSVIDWLWKLTGPVDESGEKWRSWGHKAGHAVGTVVSKIANLFRWVGKLLNLVTFGLAGKAGSWIAGKLGLGTDEKQEQRPAEKLPLDQKSEAEKKKTDPAKPVAPPTGPGTSVPVVPGASTGSLEGMNTQAQTVVVNVRSAMDQVRAIVASVNLEAEGRRMMDGLANGIRAGTPSAVRAMNDAMGAVSRNAVRGSFTDGAR